MLRGGFDSQRTDTPKSEDAPDALFGPIEGYDRVGGDLGGESLSRSLITWLDTHPAAKRGAVAGAALATLAALRARS
jgi:hypothetical protein